LLDDVYVVFSVHSVGSLVVVACHWKISWRLLRHLNLWHLLLRDHSVGLWRNSLDWRDDMDHCGTGSLDRSHEPSLESLLAVCDLVDNKDVQRLREQDADRGVDEDEDADTSNDLANEGAGLLGSHIVEVIRGVHVASHLAHHLVVMLV